MNGRPVNIPSAQVRPGDVVEVREKSRKILPVENAQQLVQSRAVPDWLTLDAEHLRGTIVRLPERQEMESAVDEQLIVEYYSR